MKIARIYQIFSEILFVDMQQKCDCRLKLNDLDALSNYSLYTQENIAYIFFHVFFFLFSVGSVVLIFILFNFTNRILYTILQLKFVMTQIILVSGGCTKAKI